MDNRPIRVMVVDDTTHVRRMLRSMLELEGFEVVAEACDADSAVTGAAEADPDVVVVDYRMPGADGLETARRIRSQRPGQVTVLYTAYTDADIERRATDAGVALVLAKEEGLEPLLRIIDTLVG